MKDNWKEEKEKKGKMKRIERIVERMYVCEKRANERNSFIERRILKRNKEIERRKPTEVITSFIPSKNRTPN
jgi:hypothetical protein